MTNLNKESKWINPFDSLEKYVIYLFKSGLIYEINELNGKTIGCFVMNLEKLCKNRCVIHRFLQI